MLGLPVVPGSIRTLTFFSKRQSRALVNLRLWVSPAWEWAHAGFSFFPSQASFNDDCLSFPTGPPFLILALAADLERSLYITPFPQRFPRKDPLFPATQLRSLISFTFLLPPFFPSPWFLIGLLSLQGHSRCNRHPFYQRPV